MKTQKITRSNLQVVYNSICQDWQKKLEKILLWSEGKQIEIPETLIQKGYKAANAEQKKLIEKYFKIEKPENIFEKYNTLDKIIKKVGKENINLPYLKPKTALEKSLNARVWLSVIISVYNNGYIFDFKNSSQYKYWIYKYLSIGGGLVPGVGRWSGCIVVHGPVDLTIKDRITGEAIIKNFPKIVDDYLMI